MQTVRATLVEGDTKGVKCKSTYSVSHRRYTMKTPVILISVILATNSLRAENIEPPSSQKIITTNADRSTTISVLDQNQKPTQISDFDASGRLRQKKLLRYDGNGHVVF